MASERIILGIDPGTVVMGYGIILTKSKRIDHIAHGIIKLSRYTDPSDKLGKIFERVSGLIEEFQPSELAIEAPFYGKNVQSMLKLGRAQGVAIAAALSKGMTYTEYAPRRIKQSITGKGSASKEQVAAMIQRLLNLKELPKDLDATDGLAAAICHYFQADLPMEKSYSSWEGFLSQNPKKRYKR